VPIGACWATDAAASALRPGDHATTFGGQALAARVAHTVLEVMEEIDAPALAEKAGARLASGLALLPGVTSVRGLGLLLGAELAEGVAAPDVVAACLEQGLVVNAVTPSTVRLAPPLTVSDAEIDEALAILGRVLEAAA
jgi:acetylornithine/succinyldiaminopimelate/putrescine aminotransferase